MPPENKKFCLTLDLKDDQELIEAYDNWHKPENIWPEIIEGLKTVGIQDMEIFRHNTRLFMIIEFPHDFDFEVQMKKLEELPRQVEWENFMDKFQQRLPGTSKNEKWVAMKQIFKLP